MTTLGDGKSNCGGICSKIGLRPITKNNILYFYVPLEGLVSYAALCVNVMNPTSAIRLLPKRDLTNFLLIHTMFGTTMYIYSRPHLQAIEGDGKKLAVAITGAGLFSLGSVLLWALIRNGVPRENALLPTLLGFGSGLAVVKLGTDYFKYLDSTVAKK